MDDTLIVETSTEQNPAGVPEGTVLTVQNEDGSVTKERIVNDLDENGNIIGAHKELVVSNG